MASADQQEDQETFDPFPRPGDADFTSFPQVAVEDTCVYQIYAFAEPTATPLAALQRILRKAKELEKSLLGKDYLWHREPFSLKLEEFSLQPPSSAVQTTSSDSLNSVKPQWRLAGSTCHGDSIADEWAIVFLLRCLTKACPEAWVRIQDGDGEFLLVEAAHALPRWLEPDVAQNRVWMRDGQLLIVPSDLETRPDVKSEDKKKSRHREAAGPLDLSQALEYIAKHRVRGSIEQDFVHSIMIEEEAFYKLRHYPHPAIEETFHTARLLIPRVLAYVIRRCPEIVSVAVEAFNQRDPLITKPFFLTPAIIAKSGQQDSKPLSFVVKDLVEVSVRTTRIGYAQLIAQEFATPPAYVGSGFDGDQEKSHQLGMKLTAGFEMILQRPTGENERAGLRINTLLDDLESGDEKLPSDDELKPWSTKDDDDAWLNVSYEDFENELDGRKAMRSQGNKEAEVGNKFGDKAAQENLRHIVERFEKFLNDDDAGPKGAVFGDEDSESDGDVSSDSDNEASKPADKSKLREKPSHLDRQELDEEDDLSDDEDDEGEDHDASFDEQEFEQMMRQMMGMPPDDPIAATASKSSSNPSKVDSDEPKAKTPHQFSFDDPHTSGAAREPTIRERIAALDLKEDGDADSTPWLTAKAFQHWAAEADVDFADAADRASYLKEQGLPDLSDSSKPDEASKPAAEQDPLFVSLSGSQTATADVASTLRPKSGAASRPRARNGAEDLPTQQLAELSESESDDDLLEAAEADRSQARRTAYASSDESSDELGEHGQSYDKADVGRKGASSGTRRRQAGGKGKAKVGDM